jgi:hypothetical protein
VPVPKATGCSAAVLSGTLRANISLARDPLYRTEIDRVFQNSKARDPSGNNQRGGSLCAGAPGLKCRHIVNPLTALSPNPPSLAGGSAWRFRSPSACCRPVAPHCGGRW